jgi:hypothetical protein
MLSVVVPATQVSSAILLFRGTAIKIGKLGIFLQLLLDFVEVG